VLPAGDSQESRLDRPLILQGVQRAKCLQHCLLDHILRQLRIPTQPERIAVQIITPRRYQTFELQPTRIACAGFGHKR